MSETNEIQPALTRHQWAEVNGPCFCYGAHGDMAFSVADGIGISETRSGDDPRPINSLDISPDDRHGLAALCLYQQSFGFTREDVDELNDIANCWEDEARISDEVLGGVAGREDDRGMWQKNAETCRSRAAKTRSIANRINRLLPAEDSNG